MRENGEKGRAISAVDALLIAIVLLFIRCRINEHTHTQIVEAISVNGCSLGLGLVSIANRWCTARGSSGLFELFIVDCAMAIVYVFVFD